MRSILNDEVKLELLDDILLCRGRSVQQIYERITEEFSDVFLDHPLPFQKLESAYRYGVTGTELIHALYPVSPPEQAAPQDMDKIVDAGDTIEQQNINIIMAGEMIHKDHCITFIEQVRKGNTHLIKPHTLNALADFLESEFCDENGNWIFHKQGQKKTVKTDTVLTKEKAIIDDFNALEGLREPKLKILANKYQIGVSTIKQLLAENNRKAKADQISDDYHDGRISYDKYRRDIWNILKQDKDK